MDSTTWLRDDFKYGKKFKMGRCGSVDWDVVVGDNVTIGDFCKLEKGVRIGNNVELMDYIKLMPETIIGDNCKLDDYVNTSGYCNIGNNVRIKRNSMIGQAVDIRDDVWIGSGVCTTRLKNPKGPNCEEEWIIIERGAMIGSKVLLLAGVRIGEGAIIGAGSVVTKDCEPYETYIGHPAKLVKQKCIS